MDEGFRDSDSKAQRRDGYPGAGVLRYLKAVLGLSLLAVLFAWVDFHEMTAIAGRCRPGWLVFSAVMTFVTLDLQVFLFGYVASPFARIPHGRLLTFTLIGRFFSLFLPSSVGGDVIKAVYLAPYFANSAMAYAAVAVQRALGGLSTLIVAVAAGLIYLPASETKAITGITIVAGITLVLMAATYWLLEKQGSALKELIDRLEGWKLGRHLAKFIRGIAAYRHQGRVVAVTFALSALSTIVAAWMYMLLAYTLRIDMSFGQALVITSMTMLSVLIPLTPGGVGVSEGAFVVTATVMGVGREEALAVALLGRVLGYVCSLPGGVLYIFVRRDTTTNLKR